MHLIETLKLALSAIWAHKLRSALTLLGMIIGVSAVVVVVSLIQGFNTYVDEKIAGIGARAYSIQRFSFEDWKDTDTIAAAQRRNKDLTLDDFEYLRGRLTLTDKLGAKARPTRAQVKRGSEVLEEVPVDGATAIVGEIEKADPADGRYFVEGENEAAARVAYIGADVAEKLFPSGSAVNQEIVVNGLPYRVVGVATAKGTVFGIPQDTFITIPLKSYRRHFGELIRWRSLYFVGTAKSDDRFADAVEEARQVLRVRRRVPAGEKDNFGVVTPDAIMGMRDRVFGSIFVVAIAVPAIALVIGGIVIMNIMLVSVTERTREIGIRKALGATRRNVLLQFLIEAVVLCCMGGIIGILVGSAGAFIMSRTAGWNTQVSPAAIGLAFAFSAIVGILFGVWPARRAAVLDPIVALRYE